jgi:two-component system NtrC family sensor kinase
MSAPTSAPHLLLVDDSPIILRAMRRMLRNDYTIFTAADGREALAHLHSGTHFDVIVCDVAMPNMSGVEFYKALLDQHPEHAARFMFATGGAETLRSMGFLLDTRVRVLLKPFTAQALRGAISRIVTGDTVPPPLPTTFATEPSF